MVNGVRMISKLNRVPMLWILSSNKGQGNLIKDFLMNFMLYASGFTYAFSPDISELNMGIGYGDYGGFIDKELYISMKGENQVIYIRGLQYLADISYHGLLTCRIYRCISPLIESYRPSYLTVAHESLKKNLPLLLDKAVCGKLRRSLEKNQLIIDIDKLANIDDKYFSIIIRDLLPLALTSILSGVHRQGLSIRQIASHTILYIIHNLYNDNNVGKTRSVEEFIKLVSALLSNLVIDVYVWIPYTWIWKIGAYGSEYVYAVASKPLTQISDKLYGCSVEKVLNIIRNAHSINKFFIKAILNFYYKDNTTLKHLIEYLMSLIKDVIIKAIFRDHELKDKIYSEVLFGALNRFYSLQNYKMLKTIRESISSTDKVNLILTATEQFSIIQLEILYEVLDLHSKITNLYILYTPETLFNLLVFKKLIDNKNIKNKYKPKEIEYIAIPSTEPYISEKIMEHLIKEFIDDLSDTITILQGSMTTILPIYNVLRDNYRERGMIEILDKRIVMI